MAGNGRNQQTSSLVAVLKLRLRGVNIRQILITNALLIGLVAMMFFFGNRSPIFWAADNLRNVALQISVLGIVGVTGALLILSGYIDLSVGSTLALGAVVTGVLIADFGWNPVIASLAAVAVGVGVGAINGALTSYGGLSPIIITLGTLLAVRGIALLTRPEPVFGFGEGFGNLGTGDLYGVPIPVIIAAGVFLLGGLFLSSTPGGRYVYAIGVNPEAAYLSGIRIRGIPFTLYVLSGASAAFGGIIFAARLNSAPPGTLGVGFELDVLTAILLGGVAFSGGRGNMFGVLLGVIFLGVLANGLTLMDVPFYWQLIAKGVALIVAASLDTISTRVVRRGGEFREPAGKERRGMVGAARIDEGVSNSRDD